MRFKGCASYGLVINIITAYSVGDVLYSCAKAKKGKKEIVCIKKINYVLPDEVINYVDTFNNVWIENELCNEVSALNFIQIYREILAATLARLPCY